MSFFTRPPANRHDFADAPIVQAFAKDTLADHASRSEE
jgi:hypothetical protein